MMSDLKLRDENRSNIKPFITVVFLLSISYFGGSWLKSMQDGIVGYFIPIVVILMFFITYQKTTFRLSNFLLACISILLIMLSFFIVGGGYGSVANNLICVIYVFLFYEIKSTEKDLDFLVKLTLIFHVIFFVWTFAVGQNAGYVGAYNVNTVAMQAAIHLFIFYLRPPKSKLLFLFENITSLAIIIYCDSRTSLGAVIICICLIVLNRDRIRNKVLKVMYWIMVALGILIPLGYVMLYENYNSSYVTSLIQFSLKHFSKNIFTGREQIWQMAFDQMKNSGLNIMLGIGSHFSNGEFAGSNFHNSFFTIFVCCGLVGYVFMMCLLYRFYSRGLNESDGLLTRTRIIYLAIMFVGIFESTLFSGHFALLAYMILMFGTRKKYEIEKGAYIV